MKSRQFHISRRGSRLRFRLCPFPQHIQSVSLLLLAARPLYATMPSSAILSALRAATAEQWELVGLVAVVAYVTYNAYFHPLSKYPGPTSARMGLPGVWLFWQAYKRRYVSAPAIEGWGKGKGRRCKPAIAGTAQYSADRVTSAFTDTRADAHLSSTLAVAPNAPLQAWALEEQHDKYGPIVRVSANQVSINTPEAASIIYAHGSSAAFPKTRFYQSFQVYPTKPSLFSDIHTESHAAFRRAISSAYSMNSLVKLEEYIEPLVSSLVKSLDKAGSGGKRMANEVEGGPATVVSLDMAKWLHFFAMDAVGELAFGRAFGFVERGGDPNRFLLGVSNLSHWGSMAGWTPSISQSARKALRWISGEPGGATVGLMTKPLIDRRYELLAAKQARAEGRDSVPKMSASTSKAEEANLEDREDMLARFIECKSPVTSQVLTSEEVLRTAISVVGAGEVVEAEFMRFLILTTTPPTSLYTCRLRYYLDGSRCLFWVSGPPSSCVQGASSRDRRGL